MIDVDVDQKRQLCLDLAARWSNPWEGDETIEAIAAALYALSTPQPWVEAPVMVRHCHLEHVHEVFVAIGAAGYEVTRREE